MHAASHSHPRPAVHTGEIAVNDLTCIGHYLIEVLKMHVNVEDHAAPLGPDWVGNLVYFKPGNRVR